MAVESRFVPVDLSGHRVAVAGGGIAALATALTLGERGADVTIVDADDTSPARTADEAFERWHRKNVPQLHHSHAFLARLRSLLLRAYPDIHRELLDAGAVELRVLDFPPPSLGPVSPEPGDEELAAIGCRRTTFEWVLRRHVSRRPWATFLSGTRVTGLLSEPNTKGVPEVRGLRLAGRHPAKAIRADIVVDATGRSSEAGRWLAEIGAAPPTEDRSSSSLLYYTRFYRLLPGVEFPRPDGQVTMADYGWLKFAIFPADGGVFSITLGIHSSFPRLKILAQPAAFDAMVRRLPGLVRFVASDTARPVDVRGRGVSAMGGLENCRRRFLDPKGRPTALRFFVVGDAAYHTNPLYGRGATQAFLHAKILGEALDASAGDPEGAARLLDLLARDEIEPFYRASVAADAEANRRVQARRPGFADRLRDGFLRFGVLPASRSDPVVFRAFLRMLYMVETPDRAFSRPEVVARSIAMWLRGPSAHRDLIPVAPDLHDTIRALERATRASTTPLEAVTAGSR